MLCYILRATSHTRLKALAQCNLRALIGRKGEDRSSFTSHEGEGLKAQRRVHGGKVYMESYVMASWNLCQAHLLEVGLTKTPRDHNLL